MTAAWLAGGLLFVVLATANAAGYRYGVSDQAFYIPVVRHAIDPSLYPRDASLIDAQGRLMVTDELLASIARVTGAPLDGLFLGAYLVSLAIIWTALVLIGTAIYRSRWMVFALGAAFTLRHRIPRTSANTFEPYFHPRMLAFGVGLLAVAALLRRRPWASILLVAASALIHVTTGLWFGILIGAALAVLDRRLRRLAALGAAAGGAAAVWALTAGPLRSSLVRMDAAWLQAVATKDSLFPSSWPLWAWLANLGMLALLWWTMYRRRTLGVQTREDDALAWGATALVAVFLVTLPAVEAAIAFPVQLQISRVFWLVDLLATIYVLSAISTPAVRREPQPARPAATAGGARAAIAAAVIVAMSIGRGAYVMLVERPERSLFEIHLVQSPWQQAAAWLARQPHEVHVLADPGHAWKYGTSIRVSAERDVMLEEVKDAAIAIYSRDVALRVNDRTRAIGDFTQLSAGHALELARRYGLDYLVTTADLALPLTFRIDPFRIYALDGRASDGDR